MSEPKITWRSTALYAVSWFIASLLVVIDLLGLREALLDIMSLIQSDMPSREAQTQFGFTMQAINNGVLFVGGVVAAGLAVALEYYFRRGETKGNLLRRVLTVVGIEVIIYVVFVLVQVIIRH
jgi:hypothetical protein